MIAIVDILLELFILWSEMHRELEQRQHPQQISALSELE